LKTTLAVVTVLGVGAGTVMFLKKHNPECIAYLRGYFDSMSKKTTENIENMI